jgi:hypothetical protein
MSGSHCEGTPISSEITAYGIAHSIGRSGGAYDGKTMVYEAADIIRSEFPLGGMMKMKTKEVRDKVREAGGDTSLKFVRRKLSEIIVGSGQERHRLFRIKTSYNNGLLFYCQTEEWDHFIGTYRSRIESDRSYLPYSRKDI